MILKYKYMLAIQMLIMLNSACAAYEAVRPVKIGNLTVSNIIEDVKNTVVSPVLDNIEKIKKGDTFEKLLKEPDPIASIVEFIMEGVEQYNNEPKDTPVPLEKYDYVIVGAGTAGCVIANRLTELADSNVLLIEAGSHELPITSIPLLLYGLQKNPIDWQYKSIPSDNYCTGYYNKECSLPRGKVMGGSSVINNIILTRGCKQDFDGWAQQGNIEWSWKDVLPYYKKLETCNVPNTDPLYHNNDGPVSVGYSPYKTIAGEAWIQAAVDYGFIYGDYNGDSSCGVSRFQLSMKNGSRDSSSRAYLHPIHDRKNLHVVKESFVTKILFNGTEAIGVVFERRGIIYTVKARREVIISAGAINSPQLLMLSGIGPKKHLEEIGIPLIKDLPVGENLMDHISTPIVFTVNDFSTVITTKGIIQNLTTIVDYFLYKTGLLSTPGNEAVVFMDLADPFNKKAWPDMEIAMAPMGMNAAQLVYMNNLGIPLELYEEVYGPLGDDPIFSVFPILLRPKSRGSITLTNSNPFTHPNINPNYFDQKEDLDKLVKGIRISIDLINKQSLKNIGATLYQVPIKACLNDGPFGSDEYWACHTRTLSFNLYHQSGTCKMGPAEDPTTVVDSRLRVHGIEHLRVIDASIFPTIPSAHINAPTFMVAEKAADMIKFDSGFK